MKTNSNHPNRPAPAAPPAFPLHYAALWHLGLFMAAVMFFWSAAPVAAQGVVRPMDPRGGLVTGAGNRWEINFTNQQPIIEYASFSIGPDVTVQINDDGIPRSLHRVTGGSPSDIRGTLEAESIIYLINPNGIAFGNGAVVKVGGLVASTLDISKTDFSVGNLNFFHNGSTGSISVASGAQITASRIAYFLGKSVDIQGQVTARDIFVGAYGGMSGSSVVLDTAGGAKITMDLTGLMAGGGTVELSGELSSTDEAGGILAAHAGAGLLQTNGFVTNMAAIHMQAVDVMRVHTLYADAAPDASISLSTLEGYLQLDRDGILHASSNITMVSTNNLVQMENNSSLTAGGNIKMNAGLSVTMNGGSSLTAGGNVEFTSGSGNITLRAVTSLYGNVTADSGAGLIMQGDVTAANGAIDLKSARVVQMESASSLTASNNITLNSESAVIYLRAVTSLYGNVAVTNQGHILLDSGISATNGTVDMRAETGDIRFDLYGRSSIGASNVWLYAGGSLNMEHVRNHVVATNASFTASNSMTLGQMDKIANDLSVTSLYGSVTITNSMAIGGDASFAALGGDLVITNAGTTVSAGGNLAMTTAGNLMMWTNTALSAGGGITLNSTNWMYLRTVTSTTGDVKATSGSDMGFWSDVTAHAGSIDLESGEYLSMNSGSSLSANSNVTLGSGRSMTLRGITSTNGDVKAVSDGGSISLYSNVTAHAGSIDLEAGNELEMLLGTSLWASNAVTLNSGTNMTLRDVTALTGNVAATNQSGEMRIHNAITAGGEINLDAASDTFVMNLGSSLSANSNVTLNSGGGMSLYAVTSTNGDVLATSVRSMYLYSNVTAQAGSIALQSGTDLVMLSGSPLSASNVALTADGLLQMASTATMEALNNMNLYSGGDMELSGTVKAGALSATSADGNLAIAKDLAAADGVSLYAGGDMTLQGVESANGNIRMDAGTNLTAQGHITANTGTVLAQAAAGDIALQNVMGQQGVTLLAAQGGVSAGDLAVIFSGRPLAVEAAKDIVVRGNVSGANVGMRSTGGSISAAQVVARTNLALEAAGDITTASLLASKGIFMQAGGNINGIGGGPVQVTAYSGDYFVNAGGAENLNPSSGTRVYAMDMTLYRLGVEGMEPMVFSGVMEKPKPVPPPVPPKPSKPKPQPQPEPDPVAPSVMNLQIQRAMAEIPQSQDIAHLREGLVDEDHLFFLDATRPHPGPQTGKTVQYLKMQEGAITKE